MGKVCSFLHPEYGRVLGEITAVKYIGRDPRGNLPNYSVTVRGRSGKTINVDLINQYTRTYPTWAAAKQDIRNYGH